jgi:hypothetical protein
MPCRSDQQRVLYVSMKADHLKRNQGWRVRIAPAAIHLDPAGRELPPKNEDCIIVQVTGEEVRLDEASLLGLTTKVGLDAIASFTSDRSRSMPGGLQYGLLLLKVQMYIQSDRITYAPCCCCRSSSTTRGWACRTCRPVRASSARRGSARCGRHRQRPHAPARALDVEAEGRGVIAPEHPALVLQMCEP